MHIRWKQHSLTSPRELFKILHAYKDIVGEIKAFSIVNRNASQMITQTMNNTHLISTWERQNNETAQYLIILSSKAI